MSNVKEHIIITGANGFIGSHLCKKLVSKGYQVVGLVRSSDSKNIGNLKNIGVKVKIVGDFLDPIEKEDVFKDMHTVIHLAARAHVTNKKKYSNQEYIEKYTKIDKNLINIIKKYNIPRLIYISSSKVAENNKGVISEKSVFKPSSPYASSKLITESIFRDLFPQTSIIRPPLVYGPEVKANFLSLLKLVNSGAPLPFGCINNKRSYMYVKNLVDLIICSIENNKTTGQSYFASDNETISLASLIRLIAVNLDRKPKLIGVDERYLLFLAKLFNKEIVLKKIIGNLEIDSNYIKNLIAWKPKYSINQGISNTCSWFKLNR